MPSQQEKYYTAKEFYEMPEDLRAELVNGVIIYMAAPSRLHQELPGELFLQLKVTSKKKAENAACFLHHLMCSSKKTKMLSLIRISLSSATLTS